MQRIWGVPYENIADYNKLPSNLLLEHLGNHELVPNGGNIASALTFIFITIIY